MRLKSVVLVDSMNWVYRAHFAHRYLEDSKGNSTSVLHGFPFMLGSLVKNLTCPVLVVQDGRADESGCRGWRFAYPQYKAKRPGKDDPEKVRIHSQLPVLFKLATALGYPVLEVPGLEADDLIAILTAAFVNRGCMVYIFSSDADFAQLTGDRVKIIRSMKDGYKLYTVSRWLQHFEVSSFKQILTYRSLVGDVSDGIPGARGVGPIRARRVIEYGLDLDVPYEQQLPPVQGVLSEEQYNQAQLSRTLSRLVTDPNSRLLTASIRRQLKQNILRACPLAYKYDDLTFRKLAFKYELEAVIRSRYYLRSTGPVEARVNLLKKTRSEVFSFA